MLKPLQPCTRLQGCYSIPRLHQECCSTPKTRKLLYCQALLPDFTEDLASTYAFTDNIFVPSPAFKDDIFTLPPNFTDNVVFLHPSFHDVISLPLGFSANMPLPLDYTNVIVSLPPHVTKSPSPCFNL